MSLLRLLFSLVKIGLSGTRATGLRRRGLGDKAKLLNRWSLGRRCLQRSVCRRWVEVWVLLVWYLGQRWSRCINFKVNICRARSTGQLGIFRGVKGKVNFLLH